MGNATPRKIQVSRRRTHEHRSDIFAQLWKQVVKPIILALGLERKVPLGECQGRDSRRRLYWCPTGLFSFLPLHAAGFGGAHGEWCSDYAVSSYTPTLTVLIHARRNVNPVPKSSLTAILVSAPSVSGLPLLEKAAEEIACVASVLSMASVTVIGERTTCGSSADMREVTERLSEAHILHFACHGEQDAESPLHSGFCLRDGKLTVAQLMQLNASNALFAFLSACETAKGDQKQPDQVVHLAAAILFVGFRSIVATMW
jgi:CHAT domain-containing protein